MCHCTARGIQIVTREIIIALNHINAIDSGSRSYPTRFARTGSLMEFSMILDHVSFCSTLRSPRRTRRAFMWSASVLSVTTPSLGTIMNLACTLLATRSSTTITVD